MNELHGVFNWLIENWQIIFGYAIIEIRKLNRTLADIDKTLAIHNQRLKHLEKDLDKRIKLEGRS